MDIDRIFRRNRKKVIVNYLFGMCLFLTIISFCIVLHDFYLEWEEQQFWDKVSSLKEESVQFNAKNVRPEYQLLYKQNSDMVGWIKIDGTKIDYPVMQTKENPQYYLRKNFEKQEDNSGTPFVDYRCNVLENRSFNVVIYGHYTNSDTMFRWLLNYESEAWYKENKNIIFDTINEKGLYEVVAAFYYDVTGAVIRDGTTYSEEDGHTFYNYIELDSKEGFDKFRLGIEKMSLYKTTSVIEKEDALITLICCAPVEFSDIKENGRFIVIAKKVN